MAGPTLEELVLLEAKSVLALGICISDDGAPAYLFSPSQNSSHQPLFLSSSGLPITVGPTALLPLPGLPSLFLGSKLGQSRHSSQTTACPSCAVHRGCI